MALNNIPKIYRQPKKEFFEILDGELNKIPIKYFNMEQQQFEAMRLLNEDIHWKRFRDVKLAHPRYFTKGKTTRGDDIAVSNGWKEQYPNIYCYIYLQDAREQRDQLHLDYDAVKKYWHTRAMKSVYDWNEFMKELFDLFEIKPIVPYFMINCSPDWKGSICEAQIELLEKTIIDYLKESERWTKATYTLESGGDAENPFLHAHIVAEPNHKLLPSIETHIAKGRHTVQIRKYWKHNSKGKGWQKALEGKHSIQRIVCRTSQMKQDKLDYLVEDKKPEGHHNFPSSHPKLNKPQFWNHSS